jgi:hypothetical protein
MKRTIAVLSLLLAVLNTTAFAGGDFDRLKSLAGEWEATTPEGKTRVIYQVISNGTALMETIVNENMVTIYHPDGDATLMTHYCAVGNQPRMRAQASRGNTMAFKFVDAANLKGSTEGYMTGLVINFVDANHVTQEWTWKAGGKETTSTFNLQRIK